MIEELKLDDATISEISNDVLEDQDSPSSSLASLFYVWNQTDINNDDLFDQKEILLKADVEWSNKNAVKFKEIELVFKSCK